MFLGLPFSILFSFSLLSACVQFFIIQELIKYDKIFLKCRNNLNNNNIQFIYYSGYYFSNAELHMQIYILYTAIVYYVSNK